MSEPVTPPLEPGAPQPSRQRRRSAFGRASRWLQGDYGRLLTGTALGQAAVLATTPLVTRLYQPAALGDFMVLMAAVGVTTTALSWRLELALVAERDERRALSLLGLCLALIAPMAAVAGGTVALLGHFQRVPAAAPFVLAVLLTVTGTFSVLRYWRVRESGFSAIARGLTAQGFVRAVAPLLLAAWRADWIALSISEALGRVTGIRTVGSGVLRRLRGALQPALWPTLLRCYWKFPALLLPSTMLDALAQNIAVPVLAFTFGAGPAGQFALTMRIGGTAVTLLAASAGDVLHARFAALDWRARRALVLHEARHLALLGLLIFLPVAVLAPLLAGPVFGSAWAESGRMLTIATPAFCAMLVAGPLSRVMLVTNRVELKLIADVTCVVLPVAALRLAARWGLEPAIAALVAATVVAYAIYFALIVRAAGTHPEEQALS
jgi:O-antigen/teichoic acid export membrane protein